MNKDKKYRQNKRARIAEKCGLDPSELIEVREWIPNEYVDQHKAHAEKMRKRAEHNRRKK